MAEPKPAQKKVSPPARSSSGGAAGGVANAIRAARGTGLVVGFVGAFLGLTSALGVVTDGFALRALVVIIVLLGLPLFVSDKLLARLAGAPDKLAVVLDVCGVLWLALAWIFVAAAPRVFVAEGDRQTRQGSVSFARAVYFLGGVSPRFRTERTGVTPAPSSTASTGVSR